MNRYTTQGKTEWRHSFQSGFNGNEWCVGGGGGMMHEWSAQSLTIFYVEMCNFSFLWRISRGLIASVLRVS